MLSKQFPPLESLREDIVNDKSLTREMLQSIVSNALEEQKKLVGATTADAIKCAFF